MDLVRYVDFFSLCLPSSLPFSFSLTLSRTFPLIPLFSLYSDISCISIHSPASVPVIAGESKEPTREFAQFYIVAALVIHTMDVHIDSVT